MKHHKLRLVRFALPVVVMLALLGVVSPNIATPTAVAQDMEQPDSVSVPGSFNAVVGCEADWSPDCEAIQMVFDEEDQLWEVSFDLPAGEYEYKAAINGAWDENYGLGAEQDGPNIVLALEEDTTVDFFYDHNTHWIADSVNYIIANVPGDYQDELGCPQ